MKCLKCGTVYADTENGCPACAYGSSIKITLKGKSGEISTSIDLDFGKVLGSKIIGDESKYLDDIQFMLRNRNDKWYLKPYPYVKNLLYVNGTSITNEIELSDGDKLSLKNKAGFINIIYT
jgi:hypothetical protein